jgi:hypothetical protein
MVEVAQKKEEERRGAEDMAGEIMARVVEETDVERQSQREPSRLQPEHTSPRTSFH